MLKRFLLILLLNMLGVVLFWIDFQPEQVLLPAPNLSTNEAIRTPQAPSPLSVRTAPVPEKSAGSYGPVMLAYPETARISEPKFSRFNEWAVRYLNSDSSQQSAFEQEGMALAQERRDQLAQIIQADPKRALELAFPQRQQRLLPQPVQQLMEEPVSGRGAFHVLAAMPRPGEAGSGVTRKAVINGKSYDTFVYGPLEGVPTLQEAILNGIAVDRYLALNEEPSRRLGTDELEAFRAEQARDPRCSISGELSSSRDDEIIVEAAGEIVPLCGQDHEVRYNNQLRAAFGNQNFSVNEDGLFQPLSSYTEGTKKLLLMRVDFSDDPGDPFTFSAGTNLFSQLDNFYRTMSYRRATFALAEEGSLVTATFRMPHPSTWYGTNDALTLLWDARNAARASGIDLDLFDFDITCFRKVPGYNWGGLGYVGSTGAWMQGGASLGAAAHELGHNFGLNHANFWDTSGTSIIGPGRKEEYGDNFDMMGTAAPWLKHFNSKYKNYLNWLRASEVQTVSTSGKYRLYAHDDPAITNGIRGLKIMKDIATNYWVEFRNKHPGNKWLPNGVGLRWARNDGSSSMLLDMTPGSSGAREDSPLLIGRTFSDHLSKIHITPVARGGGETLPYIDVVVNKGDFSTNLPPQAQLLAALSHASPGMPVQLTTLARDPNGDELAYYWEFDDAAFGSNTPSLNHTWNTPGEYWVKCTVSDMKGGVAASSTLVRVGSFTALKCEKVAQNFKMSWPDSNGAWSLYSSTQLENPGSWKKVTIPATLWNGTWTTVIPMTTSGAFYKLVRDN